VQDETRYSRNTALFGRAGQERIAGARVAIVGLGGLGCHVVQQLCYLGVTEYVLIDPDVVTESSLNRLVSAVPADAESQTLKVDVAQRLIEQVQPKARVDTRALPVRDPAAASAIATCSSLFGCLDDDGARLELIDLCARTGVAYFGLATDTGNDSGTPWYGGRVLFSRNGERCPMCMDLLDQRAIARHGMTEADIATEQQIYGVDVSDLAGTGPSVVSLNAVVASLAVTEWTVWTTGLRSPASLLEYRGAQGLVLTNRDEPRPDCYYCHLWRASARAVVAKS